MKHKLTEIHTKENSFLVERKGEVKTGNWFMSAPPIHILRCDDGDLKEDLLSDEVQMAFSRVGSSLIIASTHRIDPSVPLYRPEDLKVKERYVIDLQQMIVEDMSHDEYWLIDTITKEELGVFFYKKQKAQDYCNYLNGQHEVVDVEALAEKLALDKYSEEANPEMNIKSRLAQRLGFYSGVIVGYNAAPKHGWSDEDMRKAFDVGHKLVGDEWNDRRKLIGFDTFMNSLKNQPRTIILEYDEKPEVREDGYIIIIKNKL